MAGFKDAGTPWKDYLMYAKFTYDKLRPYGATYDNSIYW